MFKYFILLFNLIGLFIYHLFFQANVTITQNLPASASAPSSFEVNVAINKSDISGFAKFEEDFPKGFTATALKREGATILSSDNDIRFIWASLPSGPVINISFRVTVDSSVAGNQTFSGKFLYVVNNERQEADAPATSISITPLPGNSPPVAAAQPPAANTPADTTVKTGIPTAAVSPPSITVPPAQTQSTPPSVTQSFSASTVAPASDITVSIVIHRGSVTGFAKLEVPIPAGVIAEGSDMMGGSFTYADNKVKFVWLSLPADSVFTVYYKLTPSSTVSGEQSLGGEFSYLLNDNALSLTIPTGVFTVKNGAPPATAPVAVTPTITPAETPTVTAAVTTPPAVNVAATADTARQAKQQPVIQQAQAVTPEISGTQGNVKYRVQIMALHHPVKASSLRSKYNIAENINEEMLEGFTKYTVGHFTEYKLVRDHRENIKSKGVEGPFVVAYSNGQRITVQEALMITHQQWYK